MAKSFTASRKLSVFIVSGGDAMELFDPVKETLDHVSLSMDPTGEGERSLSVDLGRDIIGPGFPPGRFGTNDVAVAALVCERDIAFTEIVDQSFGLRAVGDLTACQTASSGTGVDEGVDIDGEPATGTSHATLIEIPLFLVAAC